MSIGITVMTHPDPEDVVINPVGRDAWLEFGNEGYTKVQVFLNPGVADAIVAALAPYVTGCAA